MKKFTVNCDFNGQKAPFAVYIGNPEGSHHPLHFQADWLGKQRGGSIPPDVMEAISRLKEIADKNKVSLEDLCVYALGAAQQENDNGGNAAAVASPPEDAEYNILDASEEDFDFDDEVATEGEFNFTEEDKEKAQEEEEFDEEEFDKFFEELMKDEEKPKDKKE